MAEIKTIYKGESVTILFTFPIGYVMERLSSHKVFVGETEFAGVKDGQTVKLQLKSSDTDRMIGTHRVVLWLDDTTLGLRKPYCGDLVVARTQAAGNTVSVSNISDIIVPIDISETAITAGDIMYNYVKGDPFTYADFTPEQIEALQGVDGKSAYEIWLLLGNVGTEQDFIDSLAAGGVDLTSYLKITDAANTYQPIGNYLESETDPTVPDWAKQASKPTYGVNEITGLDTALSGKVDNERVLTDVPANAKFTDTVYTHPASHPASIINQDANNRFVTDAEKSTWNAKQEALGFTAENVSNKKTTLTDSDTDYPTTKAVNTALSGKANTTHTHDDRYYTESEVNTLLAAKNGAYNAEKVTSPTAGTLTLKNSTETVLDGALTTSNVFTVALPTPVSGKVNESVLIFKIGATLPTITQPSGIVWRGSTPTLAVNTNWTIVYEQVNTTGTTYEIWAIATKNS